MKKRLLNSIASAFLLTAIIVDKTVMFNISTQKVEAADYQTDFLNKVTPQAVKVAKKYGIYPSVMIAQAIVESGWGRSSLAVNANNLFGIKADNSWTGATYSATTREETKKGKSYNINARFKKYSSLEESFEDNGQSLRRGVSWQPLRYQGAWIENASTYAAATKALTGTYATANNYNSALNARIIAHNLNKYDPIVSKVTKTYTVDKSGATYNWPTDSSIAQTINSVNQGEKVTVVKTITFNDGSSRMYINGKGWIDGSYLNKSKSQNNSPVAQAPRGMTKTSKNLMHNAYVYDNKGKKIKGKILRVDNEKGFKLIDTYGTKKIKHKNYYRIGENEYIAAGNIDGTLRFLKRNSYVYSQDGSRNNGLKHKKNAQVATYGTAISINGKKYYRIGIRQYIKKANFM